MMEFRCFTGSVNMPETTKKRKKKREEKKREKNENYISVHSRMENYIENLISPSSSVNYSEIFH